MYIEQRINAANTTAVYFILRVNIYHDTHTLFARL